MTLPTVLTRRHCIALVTGGLLLTSGVAVATPASAMSGGTALDRGPAWIATLAVRGSGPLEQRASCSGALVAPDAVLTAAHCVADLSRADLATNVEVHIGAGTLSRVPGRTRRVVDRAIHPRFALLPSPAAPDDPGASSATFDVAVLRLDRPVRGVRPLPLLTRPVRAGRTGLLFGHGITSPTSGTSDQLRAGRFTVRRTDDCARSTPAPVDRTAMTCVVGRRTAACTGDSGGPFVLPGARGPVLAGIFSFGMETAGAPCGSPGPDFVTSSAAIATWVQAQLQPDHTRADKASDAASSSVRR